MKTQQDIALMMLYLHSKQCEMWSKFIQEEMKVIHEFKFRINQLYASSRAVVNYSEKIMKADDYETSAEISDSLYKMAQLPNEKIQELSNIMEEFINKNLKQ
jgi:hypothetical protein